MKNAPTSSPAVIAVLIATLAACTSPSGPANSYSAGEGSIGLEAIEGNRDLANYFDLENYRAERRDGRLHVQVELVNRSSSNRKFEWIAEWFDASGFSLGTTNNWKPEKVAGYGSKTIAITGPKESATDFTLHIRPPNPVR